MGGATHYAWGIRELFTVFIKKPNWVLKNSNWREEYVLRYADIKELGEFRGRNVFRQASFAMLKSLSIALRA